MAFAHFTASAGFDKNVFQVEIMDHLINAFFWTIAPNFSSGFFSKYIPSGPIFLPQK
jgi:hypothetical protein